jgi:hypothetical protein
MRERDRGGLMLRSGGDEATAAGAMAGWFLLAVPAIWLFYGTGVWAGYCVQNDHLAYAVVANILAAIFLGVWISRLRGVRDRRQDRLDKFEAELQRLLKAHPDDEELRQAWRAARD